MTIKTDEPFRAAVYYDVKPDNSYCQTYLGTQRVGLNIEVCGLETATVVEPGKEYEFWAKYLIDENFKITNHTDDFTSDSNECGINKWELWSSNESSVSITGDVVWTDFITIDQSTGVITVNHNGMTGTKETLSYEMWIYAETKGKKSVMKKIKFNLILEELNRAPRFETVL